MKRSSVIERSSVVIIPAWDGRGVPLQLIKFDHRNAGLGHDSALRIALPPSIRASSERRQADYVAGRLAARQALDLLGLGHCTVGTGKWREPLWPAGVMGSITHNEHFAGAVAVWQSDNRGIGIGIDIESVTAAAMVDMRDAGVMSTQEWDDLCRVNTHLPLESLACLLFSAKESFFKASFNTVGDYIDFDAVTLQRIDLTHSTIDFSIPASLGPQLPAGAMRKVHFQFVDDTTILTSCNLPALA